MRPEIPAETARVPVCRAVIAAALALVTLAGASPASAATGKQVNDALERATKYLYSQQKPDGTWEDSATPPGKDDLTKKARQVDGGQWGGQTALAVYALLAAGEKAQEPKLAKAIEFLKKNESVGTYALGLRMQVWLLLPQTPDVLKAMNRDAKILLGSTKSEGTARGMYHYVFNGPGGDYSHSRAQYGVLGMWAADQMGFEIPTAYWKLVQDAWINHQDPSGGWTYKKIGDTVGGTPQFPLTPGMTAAGVATLYITQDYVNAADGLACRGNQASPAIEKGIAWMTDNFDKVASDAKYERAFPYITLYAVERIGLAGGIKYFGKVDWYQKGADWLLSKQGKSGGWAGSDLGELSTNTCFAMLFLARGRHPVAFNKLDYGGDLPAKPTPQQIAQAAPWNQRPRDVANVTRWLGNNLEVGLNWQVVSLNAPSTELLDAPVLYISGNRPLTFTDEQKAKLREFVEMGGLILGHADCAAPAFSASFAKLGSELFPTYEFRELPESHAIYEGHYPRRTWKTKPSMQGLSNGVRELMLLIPTGDPARWWQVRTYGGKEDFWKMAANIFLYAANGMELHARGETHWVTANPKAPAANHKATAYRLQYAGNWDPEPGGWRRLANILKNDHRTDLTVETVKLGDGKLPPGKAVAHLTGTAKFTLSPPQQAELKAFVAGGGTVIVDAAGGSPDFATAAEQQLAATFGAGAAAGGVGALMPPDHTVFTQAGRAVDKFNYRPFVRGKITGALNAPRLRVIEQAGRPAVFYSREDLSVGIVGQPVDGVLGYSAGTATDLMTALVLHAVPPPKPATRPASGATTAPTPRAPTAKPTAKPPKPAAPAK